jgi:hypothetical protein
LIVTLRRLLLAAIVAFAFVGGACIFGPKQDDPSDNGGPDTDSGSSAGDTASTDGFHPQDTGGGSTDASHDTTPTSDVASTDSGIDGAPGDGGGDIGPSDAPGDATDDGASDGGSTDGSVE